MQGFGQNMLNFFKAEVEKEETIFSSGSSDNDLSEGETMMEVRGGRVLDKNADYEEMNEMERQEYLQTLWLALGAKCRGAQLICTRFGDLNYNMFVYGISKDLEKQSDVKMKPFPFILGPESKFKAFWNVVIILLLLYTGSVVPYRTAFVDETGPSMQAFELMVDVLFVIDLFVNFLSAYENDDKKIEMSLARISVNYLTGWFMLDLFACLPF